MPSLLLLLLLQHQRAYHLVPVCVFARTRNATTRVYANNARSVLFLHAAALRCWLRPLLLLLLQNNLYANYSHIDIQLSTHTHTH